jgi:hypothetical protein
MTKKTKPTVLFWAISYMNYEQILYQDITFYKILQRSGFSLRFGALQRFANRLRGDPWEEVLRCKVVFLQFLSDWSDRKMEEKAVFNLLWEWFLGKRAETLPHDISPWCDFGAYYGMLVAEKMVDSGFEH